MDVGKHPVELITAMEAEHLGCCIDQAIPGAIKPVGRSEKTNLTEQGVLAGTWAKKNMHAFWKWQANQRTYKDVMKLCMEKIRRAKLELNLAIDIKDNKTCFYKYICNKRAKEYRILYWMQGLKIMIENEKRLMPLVPYLPEFLRVRSIIIWVFGVHRSLSWKRGMESPHILRGHTISHLLSPFDTCWSMVPNRIHPSGKIKWYSDLILHWGQWLLGPSNIGMPILQKPSG